MEAGVPKIHKIKLDSGKKCLIRGLCWILGPPVWRLFLNKTSNTNEKILQNMLHGSQTSINCLVFKKYIFNLVSFADFEAQNVEKHQTINILIIFKKNYDQYLKKKKIMIKKSWIGNKKNMYLIFIVDCEQSLFSVKIKLNQSKLYLYNIKSTQNAWNFLGDFSSMLTKFMQEKQTTCKNKWCIVLAGRRTCSCFLPQPNFTRRNMVPKAVICSANALMCTRPCIWNATRKKWKFEN